MLARRMQIAAGFVAVAWLAPMIATAQECLPDLSRPACGKVCKLVSETKKLTDVGFGNECKSICLPGPSRPGCKHCAVSYGDCKCDPCECCQESAPVFEFCWRDWFACGCARPRTVKVLTKWQVEKKVCWYHWEVVDASCCDCVGQNGGRAADCGLGIAQSVASRTFYKAAPDGAALGDVLTVTDDEWVRLSVAMAPTQDAGTQIASKESSQAGAVATNLPREAAESQAKPVAPSIAERLERIFK